MDKVDSPVWTQYFMANLDMCDLMGNWLALSLAWAEIDRCLHIIFSSVGRW